MKAGTLLLLGSLAFANVVAAQDSLAVAPAAPDTIPSAVTNPRPNLDSVPTLRPPTTPMGAFWRSLLIPGWGQANLGRKTAGAFFLAAEGVSLGMVLTTTSQLNYLEDINSGSVDSKKQQQQDWLVLLGLNHLLAAMEAYVSAHLWDFPGDLSIQAAPAGGVAGAVSLPVRIP